MKRVYFMIAMLFVYSSVVFAQQSMTPPAIDVLYNTNTPSTAVYVAPPSLTAKAQEADITVTFIGDGNAANGDEWTPNARAAFNFAIDILETALTSEEVIRVEATMQPLNAGVLGNARANSVNRDWPNVVEPFEAGTWYVDALADKLAEDDLNAGDPDIICNFNTAIGFGVDWYFGTDGQPGNNQIDFVTVVLHELMHGLGITSSAFEDNQTMTLEYELAGFPFIFDLFIEDGAGTRLTTLATPSVALDNFLQSEDLFFTGAESNTANGNTDPQIFAPNPFEPGSSIAHLDEDAFPQNDPNALMRPGVSANIAIHNPGPVGEGMLLDIGWDANFAVGIEDEVEIQNISPPLVYTQGQSYSYSSNFIDHYPTGNYVVSQGWSWRLEVFTDQGPIVHRSALNLSTNTINFNLGSLPTGHNYMRNVDGTVRARLIHQALDNDGWGHDDEAEVKILHEPETPLVRILKQQLDMTKAYRITDIDCEEVTIAFYAEGATDYELHWGTTKGGPYANTVVVPQGQFSYTVGGLDPATTYYFNVEAFNTGGSKMGNEVIKSRCIWTVVAQEINDYTISNVAVLSEDFVDIGHIRFYAADEIEASIDHVVFEQAESHDVDISSLQQGLYIVEVEALNGDKGYTEFYKAINTDLWDISIVPNPVGDDLGVIIDDGNAETDEFIELVEVVRVGDPSQYFVFNFDGTSNNESMDARDMAPGTYTVVVTDHLGRQNSTLMSKL